ncbi:Hypothetical predicted protein, partial [Pelobates cultripes]
MSQTTHTTPIDAQRHRAKKGSSTTHTEHVVTATIRPGYLCYSKLLSTTLPH